MMGFGLGMGLWGLLAMVIFWALLIAGAIWLVRLLFPVVNQSDQGTKPSGSAEETIKLRYAQGELTEEQYQRMLEIVRR